MCTARKFAGKKICVGKKFQCDNVLQCRDGKDEEHCEEEYKKKRIFTRDQRVICRSPFLNISNKTSSGKFFPMRAIRWVLVIIIVIITKQHQRLFLVRCDMIAQCPSGEDEEGCYIPDSVRQIMSLFFGIVIVIFFCNLFACCYCNDFIFNIFSNIWIIF